MGRPKKTREQWESEARELGVGVSSDMPDEDLQREVKNARRRQRKKGVTPTMLRDELRKYIADHPEVKGSKKARRHVEKVFGEVFEKELIRSLVKEERRRAKITWKDAAEVLFREYLPAGTWLHADDIAQQIISLNLRPHFDESQAKTPEKTVFRDLYQATDRFAKRGNLFALKALLPGSPRASLSATPARSSPGRQSVPRSLTPVQTPSASRERSVSRHQIPVETPPPSPSPARAPTPCPVDTLREDSSGSDNDGENFLADTREEIRDMISDMRSDPAMLTSESMQLVLPLVVIIWWQVSPLYCLLGCVGLAWVYAQKNNMTVLDISVVCRDIQTVAGLHAHIAHGVKQFRVHNWIIVTYATLAVVAKYDEINFVGLSIVTICLVFTRYNLPVIQLFNSVSEGILHVKSFPLLLATWVPSLALMGLTGEKWRVATLLFGLVLLYMGRTRKRGGDIQAWVGSRAAYLRPDRKGVTVNVWHPLGDMVGHVSLTLSDDTYISWWPSEKKIKEYAPVGAAHLAMEEMFYDAKPIQGRKYTRDVAEEGREPVKIELPFGLLDEEKIKQWWTEYKNDDSNLWQSVDNNCCTVAYTALLQGGAPHFSFASRKYSKNVDLTSALLMVTNVKNPTEIQRYASGLLSHVQGVHGV